MNASKAASCQRNVQAASPLFSTTLFDKKYIMTPEEIYLLNQNYTAQASQIRGVLINHIILLERLMDSYISKYFCQTEEKATELMDLIISTKRITFESKAQVFKTILDKVLPERKNDNQKLAKDFQFIAGERNMLAHYFLDITQPSVDRYKTDGSTITSLKIEKTRTSEIFDFERVKKLGDIVDSYNTYIIEILNKK